MHALLPVFTLAVAAVFVGAGVLGAFRPPPTEMIWQNPQSITSCGSTYGSQAVQMVGQSVDSGSGCRSTWFVFIPSTEGGDESAQLRYLTSHRSQFKGVFADDFGGGSSYPALTAIFGAAAVCPVLYQPTGNYPCVVAVVSPTVYYQWFRAQTNGMLGGSDYFVNSTTPLQDVSVQQWTTAARWFVGQFRTTGNTTVITLVYGTHYSLWSYPLPANYLQGVSQAEPDVVVWH